MNKQKLKNKFNFRELEKKFTSQSIISRFAPSPTGFLHLGHVLSALYCWTITKSLKGRVLLRIEDHDRQRCKPEYTESIFKDLEWLGFNADDICLAQSQNLGRYEEILEQLWQNRKVFVCHCSRKDIQTRHSQESSELHYPGICKNKAYPFSNHHSIRLKVEESQNIRFFDIWHGDVSQKPSEQCGDFILKDRNGCFSYQFATVVDDIDQNVNLVIRGNDILPSTGRQLLLRKTLGNTDHPIYLHHPLIFCETQKDKKLSKRDFSTAIKSMREQGMTKEEVFGLCLFQAGFLEKPKNINCQDSQNIVISTIFSHS